MDPIDQSAKKIADIGVIDGIAFPTNILALNAAVEADCAGEQSRGIEHVNQALVQMGQVTQQNAALVEQAAADSMKDQADHLAQVIGVFTLAPGGGARA